LQAMPQPAELRMVNTGPDASRINEPAVRIVIGEQERPEPGPSALGIGPPDDHELLPLFALDLDPHAAIAGRIGCVSAFGDDALQRQFTNLGVELRALSDLVIAEVQRRACIRQKLPEPLLSLT